MQVTWLSLLPPIVVIGVVCITHQLNFSLIVGIVCAALIVTHGNVLSALMMCGQKMATHFSDSDNIYLYLFLLIISCLITLLTVTGSATGCAQIIGRKIRTKRGVEMSTIMLSFLLCIDDYLSILTVGFVMRPIVDRLAVARTKLAYIIHALAGPLVIIVPISTWAAVVLAQLDNAGIHLSEPHKIIADPLYVYLKTVPFIFYSMLIVIAVLFVVITRIGYGLIGHDEQKLIAVNDGVQNDEIIIDDSNKHSLIEMIMPISILIGGVFMGTLYAGGYSFFGGNNSFFEAFKENDKTFLILLLSGLTSFGISLLCSLYKKFIVVAQIGAIMKEGFLLIYSSVIMVICVSILGSFLRLDLQTGSYVAHVLLGSAPIFLIPVLLFVVSLVITLMTGSAWGTFSIVIPIMTQMLLVLTNCKVPVMVDQIPMLFPALGAVLSGAVCGNHISPFADTTTLTAMSTGIAPLDHARTQYAYAVPVIIGTAVSFLVAGLTIDYGIGSSLGSSLGAGIVTSLLLLCIGNMVYKIE